VSASLPGTITAGTLHRFYGAGRVVGRKYGRWYRCYAADDQVRLTAQAFRSSQPLQVYLSGNDSRPDLTLKLRRTFPLTGKIDVLDGTTQTLVGVVTRGRKFLDADERLLGRFHDAKSWKEHLAESLIDAAGQMIFGGGDGHVPPGSDRFALVMDKRTVGSLTREQLPFFPDPPRRPRFPRTERILQRLLPRNLGRAIFALTPPVGWRLDIFEPAAVADWRLLWCAALMTVELRNW
jgi:hypothetical protein